MDKKQKLDSVKTTTLNEANVFDCQNSIKIRDNVVIDVLSKNEIQIENLEDNADSSQGCKSTITSSEAKATYNIRGLTKHAETYELETFKKNALIIIHNSNNNLNIPNYNDVTVEDAETLKTTFKEFCFEVTEYKELTKKEIFDRLANYFSKDFTDYGCVGIAVLTEGDLFHLWARDEKYSPMQILEYFNVHDKPTLVTKPKFLIIQACKDINISCIATNDASRIMQRALVTSTKIYKYHLPVDSDILMVFSSYILEEIELFIEEIPKNIIRWTFHQCWNRCFKKPITYTCSYERTYPSFIQILCSKINQLAATLDVESIIGEVKREIALKKIDSKEDVPITTTTLIRKLYLKKFDDPPVLLPEGATSDDEADPLNREAAMP